MMRFSFHDGVRDARADPSHRSGDVVYLGELGGRCCDWFAEYGTRCSGCPRSPQDSSNSLKRRVCVMGRL
jgi:hypothetical protein